MSRTVVFPELEAAMAYAGDSQKDLAALLGVSIGQMSRRLSGAVEWRDGEIRQLCSRYGKPYEILFERNEVSAANG